ncbi:MAG: hypothetical protein U0R72_04185 [Nakamurella multipartita]
MTNGCMPRSFAADYYLTNMSVQFPVTGNPTPILPQRVRERSYTDGPPDVTEHVTFGD